ncbi:MAG: prepilin-type N-terminal cleavage/methylation domain-containing protein, partial [Phycisphaerae bacterium]
MNRRRIQQIFPQRFRLNATRPTATRLTDPLTQHVQMAQSGFSLIEVIMATAILMGSTVVLMRLAGMGREQFTKAKLLGEAQSHCETILNEIVLGKRPLREVQPQSFFPNSFQSSLTLEASDESDTTESETTATPSELYESDAVLEGQTANESEWKYLIRLKSVRSFPQLRSITVTVYHSPPMEESVNRSASVAVDDTANEAARPSRIRSTLTRWVRVPQRATSENRENPGNPDNSESSGIGGEPALEEG